MLYLSLDYDFDANIHMFRYLEFNIILDVNSGAIHILDDLSHHLITKIIEHKGDYYGAMEELSLRHSPEEVMEAMYEIAGCWEDGSLFTDEEHLAFDYQQMPIKALCLNISHACNMQCRYCFAHQGNFGMETTLMTSDTAVKAIEFLLRHSNSAPHLEVDFFGGEPLLNPSVIRHTIAYAREKEKATGQTFHFTLTTNTLLLDDDIMDLIIEEDIGIIMSLDGRPATNDNNRRLPGGSSSYNQIVAQIDKMLQKNPISYYIRGTFTRDNLDFANDVRHIVDLGCHNLSLEPAVGADQEWAIRPEDLPKLTKEYENLAQLLLKYYNQGVPVNFFHYNLDLQKGPCIAKRSTGCGAGVEYLAVTPNGDLYPCHQLVGQADMKMGNIETGITLTDTKRSFASNTLFDKPACRKCWARYYCGGGCHANNYFANHTITQPYDLYCNIHRQRIESAIYLDLKKRFSL